MSGDDIDEVGTSSADTINPLFSKAKSISHVDANIGVPQALLEPGVATISTALDASILPAGNTCDEDTANGVICASETTKDAAEEDISDGTNITKRVEFFRESIKKASRDAAKAATVKSSQSVSSSSLPPQGRTAIKPRKTLWGKLLKGVAKRMSFTDVSGSANIENELSSRDELEKETESTYDAL